MRIANCELPIAIEPHIYSGCIGINITGVRDTAVDRDTAVPYPYNLSGVGTRHCRVLYICRVLACHSGAAGIDIISWKTAIQKSDLFGLIMVFVDTLNG